MPWWHGHLRGSTVCSLLLLSTTLPFLPRHTQGKAYLIRGWVLTLQCCFCFEFVAFLDKLRVYNVQVTAELKSNLSSLWPRDGIEMQVIVNGCIQTSGLLGTGGGQTGFGQLLQGNGRSVLNIAMWKSRASHTDWNQGIENSPVWVTDEKTSAADCRSSDAQIWNWQKEACRATKLGTKPITCCVYDVCLDSNTMWHSNHWCEDYRCVILGTKRVQNHFIEKDNRVNNWAVSKISKWN